MNLNQLSGNILVVIEQKGSDEVECRERFLSGCSIFNKIEQKPGQHHLLIVGGANGGASPETIHSWCPDDLKQTLEINNKAGNTHEKALSILNYVQENNINTIIQVTSLYHSLRAYLTTRISVMPNANNITFMNCVCDCDNLDTIHFALLDEIFLAKSINNTIKFDLGAAAIDTYMNILKKVVPTSGVKKYLEKRYGEASRIVEYSEIGKSHLTTTVDIDEILNSYMVE